VFKIPRGTRDFNPHEMQKRRYIEEVMCSTFKSYGYREVQTPTFETLELFTAKSGDSIIEEIYSFTDKGGRNLSLRPELTAPVIRFYVDKLQMEPKPLKMYYFGNCYRYDRPQKGRYREFTQAGCELIGTDTSEAISELIAMAYNILKKTGVKNLRLNIGNLDLISSIFSFFKINNEQQKYLIPLIDKSMFEDIFDALKNFNLDAEEANAIVNILNSSNFDKIKDYLKNDEKVKNEIESMEKVLDLLKNSYKIDFKIKMSIVRGLDYYKGIVFEIEAPSLGAEKQLCGGGIYELIPLFGGKETPSAGFAIGFDRTLVALEADNYEFQKIDLDVYIIPIEKNLISKTIEIAQTLRNNNITVDIDLLNRGLGKALKYASSKNAKKAIIIGPDELEKKSVSIRDMKTGTQEIVKIENISDLFM
jgi:histidyl-tRNA synthetase